MASQWIAVKLHWRAIQGDVAEEASVSGVKPVNMSYDKWFTLTSKAIIVVVPIDQ